MPNSRLALFVCNDLPGLMILNGIVPALKKINIDPIVFNTSGHRNRNFRVPTPAAVSFFNVGLLTNQLIPFLDAQPVTPSANHTYKRLTDIHGVEYHEIEDVNAPELIDRIKNDPDIVGGVSERFLQVIEQDMIDALRDKGFLWNLHSGLLPEYKGLLTPFRAIDNGEKTYGLTLHDTVTSIDEGGIVDTGILPLDGSRPIFDLYMDSVPRGIEMIANAVGQFQNSGYVHTTPQPHMNSGQNYTNPTTAEMMRYAQRGVIYADPQSYVERVATAFTVDGSDRQAHLKSILHHAIQDTTVPSQTAQPAQIQRRIAANGPHFL